MNKFIVVILSAAVATACTNGKFKGFATGTFDASEVIISSEIPGKIVEFRVEEGERVEQGQVLAVMDTIQIYLQKQQLLKNIEALRSNRPDMDTQLAPYREELQKQQREIRRITNLVEADAATTKSLDDIKSGVAVAEKQLAAQENALRKNLAALDAQIDALVLQSEQVDDQLRRASVTAPISGTVISKYAQEGELAAQGRPLLKIADTENMFLRAYLTSEQLTDVKLGQGVVVTADFGGGNRREYPGVVTWISDRGEFTPKNIVTSNDRANMVYAIKVSIRNDGYAKIGMYGELTLK